MARYSLLLVIFAAACGTSDAASPGPTTTPKVAASTTDGKALCVQIFTRNRTCTNDYIPALVDIRAKYDQPAGIAASVASDRAGVIAAAMAEWAEDGTDASIDASCTKIIAAPPAQADIEAARACLDIADCAAYTACVMPQFEKRFQH